VKVEIKDISQVLKEMKIIIDPEQATKDYYKVLNKIKHHVAIPGFRKGKSPIAMIERTYADYIKEEFFNQNIGEYYKAALDLEDINPINQGEAKDIEWEKGKELVATFTFEIMPEIKVEKYKNLEIPYEKMKFQKKMITDTIEDFRKKMANEIDAEISEKEDKLNITINFLDEKDEITKSIDREIILNKNQYSTKFNTNLTGKKVNDEITTKLFTAKQKIEESDFTEEIKNKDFLVKINDIKRELLPELNDEFAKDLEYASLEEMKKKIEADLKIRLETENRNHLKDAIYGSLIKENPFELPASMVNKYAEQLAQPYAEAYKMEISQMLPYYTQIAEFNMKSHYIMEELKKIENIEVSDADLEETITEAATNMKMDVEEYKKMYKKQTESEDFKFAVVERKIVDIIKESAKFVPLPKEEPLLEEEAEK
jgi:trigger factor